MTNLENYISSFLIRYQLLSIFINLSEKNAHEAQKAPLPITGEAGKK